MKSFIIKQKDGTEHVVMVDDTDYDEVMKYKWYVYKSKETYYVRGRQAKKQVHLHRYLLGLTNPKIQIDHRDHNGLNNQRDNLRIATNQQNQFNRQKTKLIKGMTPTSLYKGVSWKKSHKKWYAQIQTNGKTKHIGLFTDEYEAHLAYNSAAEKIQGEYKYKKSIKAIDCP